MSTKTFLFGSPYKTKEQAKKAINTGIIACYFFAVLGVLISFGEQNWYHMVDVMILIVIGASLQKWKSRTAAVCMLIGVLLDAVNRAMTGQNGYLVTLIVFICAYKAVKGTFSWHAQDTTKEILAKS